MTKRQYSDEDKATALAALDANGGNVLKTSRQIAIPEKTLSDWSNLRGVNLSIAEIRVEKRADLRDRLEEIAHGLIDSIPFATGNVQQLTTSLGIVIDKMQLLTGKPTSITDDAALTDETRAKRIRELLNQSTNGATSEP